MGTRILVAGLCLLLVIGCAKRGAKNTAPANDSNNEQARANTPPAVTPVDKKPDEKKAGSGEGASSWLKDDRFQTKQNPQLPVDSGPVGSKPPSPINIGSAPQGGFAAPVPGVQPGGGGKPPVAGVLQPVPVNPPPIASGGGTPIGAANKIVAMADMREVWVFIENASGASGKMPTAALTYAALREASSPAAALVKDGAIILTGSTSRESVWAFEARAYLNGGLVVSQNGVETLTAAELKTRLGK
ncbi:unnamed protein product [Gemmata massiliana]|uniref:Uncharacterized protein n=1 Tax=Gemmata massiliana TaxID=1210884 RepID=A0A6P2D4L5_9BACT|nr:hypothetical protein [Gemmata massiliana]VTR94402.1 unnamed protein product [Gemmata massiliana]